MAAIAIDGEAWAAWRQALREAVPRGSPGGALAWELGALRVEVEPGLGAEVALSVTVACGLEAWALPRAACPTDTGAIATGDRDFDREVLLVGDRQVLAVLDEPTRALLRGLVVARRARLEGGVLRLDGAAASALQADQIAPTLARLGELGVRLARARTHFDEELERHLGSAPAPAIRACLVAAFPSHPAVARAQARALAAEAQRSQTPASLTGLLSLVEDRDLPSVERLRAARTMLELSAGPTLAPDAWSALARLAEVPSLPATVRTNAIARVLAHGPASELPSLRSELMAEHLPLIVAAMRRSPEHRRAGARQLLASQIGGERFRFAGSLAPADVGFVAEALAESGLLPAALDLFVAAWNASPDEDLLKVILETAPRLGASLDAFFSALDERALDHLVTALPRAAAASPDGALALVALYPRLADGEERRTLVATLGTLADARATELLVEVLASADDALVDVAIGALAEVGDARALKALGRQAEGFFRDRARKAAARAAADRIRARVGDPEGALTLAGEGGGLALVSETRGPKTS